ncbi:MAG TPA: hypothetical protein VFC85_02350, partial [Verrucomicrobiae bacterium]|nr:hypothetical protein [Verrucomicrobiae bacterium]
HSIQRQRRNPNFALNEGERKFLRSNDVVRLAEGADRHAENSVGLERFPNQLAANMDSGHNNFVMESGALDWPWFCQTALGDELFFTHRV